jgi:phage baseplate assembly protein W
MARTIYQYQPINTIPDRAIGITLPFNRPGNSRQTALSGYASSTSGNGLFNQSYSTEEQALSNLKNLLLTVRGERLMQPTFGTNLQRLIFEQSVDDLGFEIDNELRESINYWLPYIVIEDLNITAVPDSYSIRITLTITVTQTGAQRVINIMAAENSLVVTLPVIPINTQLAPII